MLSADKTKMNVCISVELLGRAREYAEKNYLSLSGLVSLALNSYLNSQTAMVALNGLADGLARFGASGEMQQDDLDQLNDFLRLVSTMNEAKRYTPLV